MEHPEVLGSLMAMPDINRYSHVVMDGSPANVPARLQGWVLRLSGGELRATTVRPANPGRALPLLPPADLPVDLSWAAPNPRIADAIAPRTATVERETAKVISRAAREWMQKSLAGWSNEPIPVCRG